MHRMILGDAPGSGQYKRYLNSISGSEHQPPPPLDVPAHMRSLTVWLSTSDVHPLVQATVAHAWLTYIHPFDDGPARVILRDMIIASSDAVPRINLDQIRPYASALVLRHTGPDDSGSLDRLMAALKQLKMRDRGQRTTQIVASGTSRIIGVSDERSTIPSDADAGIGLDGFVSRVTEPPSWAMEESPFLETSFDLVIAIRMGRLVAVHCDSGLADAVQTWLDKEPRPPFRRIPPGTLNAALLTGEARGLWLRGTHARRTTKADSKNLGGRRLQDALNPLEDSSFALGSARAELPVGEVLGTFSGTVGTTLRKSLVWISRTSDFQEFFRTIRSLLRLLDSTLAAGASVDSPYPWLATELRGLEGVSTAYELTTLSVDEVPRNPSWPEEAMEAAALLQRTTFDVAGEASSPNFSAGVALDGCSAGKIRCVVEEHNGSVRLKFGWEGQPTDERSVRMVLDALEYTDLVTVYYESGHAVSSGGVWSAVIRPAPFRNWIWCDFRSFDVCQEKPDARTSQDLHDVIALSNDKSLFSWVVNNYGRSGWLTCDDGPGEVADFVKYDGDGTITLIHVKAARSDSSHRPVNVTSYEVVTSQATKNLTYLNVQQLTERLSTPGVSRQACWYDGQRIADRSELIEFLQLRPSQAPVRVLIVQPQLTKSRYEQTGAMPEGAIALTRLRLLETMLNAARGAVTGLGADLHVAASAF